LLSLACCLLAVLAWHSLTKSNAKRGFMAGGKAAQKDSLSVTIASDEGNIPVTAKSDYSTTSSSPSFSVTRPADTNAYAAGDVIGAATGSSAAITLLNVGVAGQLVKFVDGVILISRTDIPAGMSSFTLRFYNATPPSAYGDNVAWDLPSGDISAYLCSVQSDSVIDRGSTLEVTFSDPSRYMRLITQHLYAYLTTDSGFTPNSGTVKTGRLNFAGI